MYIYIYREREREIERERERRCEIENERKTKIRIRPFVSVRQRVEFKRVKRVGVGERKKEVEEVEEVEERKVTCWCPIFVFCCLLL